MKKSLLAAIALFCALTGIGQHADVHLKFYESATAYFKLDREKIHLHPNKSVFLNTETIWFKGYITELKSGLPYGQTTNVHVQLRGLDGKVIDQVVILAESSVFTGFFPLSDKIKGGLYHIHAYTNFMNNFAEDESTMAQVSVIDVADQQFYNPLKSTGELQVTLHPEGGSVVEGIANTIGVWVRDCNGNGVSVQDATVMDGAGTSVTGFSTSESGFGRFDIPLAGRGPYTVKFTRKGQTVTTTLPATRLDGVALSANSYANPQKTIIRLRTNGMGKKNGPYTLFVQQGALASGSPIDLAAGEQTLAIPSAELPYGVNTLFLTDAKGKLVASRMFYNPAPSAGKLQLSVLAKKDSITVTGVSPVRNGELSISILPVGSLSATGLPDMVASAFANPFIRHDIGTIAPLVDDFSRKNGFELDNRLLCNQPKYGWDQINGNPPVEKHPFDMGLTIKGSINNNLRDRSSARVTLNSIELGLNETLQINDRNEVIFENVVAVDSATVHFSLQERGEKLSKVLMAYSVINANRQFVKPFTPVACNPTDMMDDIALPKIDGAVQLEDVKVQQQVKKEKQLSNLIRYNNNWARGYKITDTEYNTYQDVLSFIQNHGYNVERNAGNVIIKSRISRSFAASLEPAVYIDDAPLTNFAQLEGMGLNQVDEIYINKFGYGGGLNASNGIIRIYTRRDMGAKTVSAKTKSQSFVIEKGFQRPREFNMPRYDSFLDPGFQQLGTLDWIPRVGTDSNGRFAFNIQSTGLDQVMVVIRGIASDGTVVSQTQMLNLK